MSLDEMDQLTLECLVNKHQYQKYLAKSNPELFKQQEIFAWKVKRYREQIIEKTIQCLDEFSPSTVQRSQLQQAFQNFLKETILEIDTKKETVQESLYETEIEKKEEMFIEPPSINPIEYWKKYSVIKK
jgi:flagellar biosynthesis component FlhA